MNSDVCETFFLRRCVFKNCWSITGKNGGVGAYDNIFQTFSETPISFCNFINCSVGDHSATSSRCGGSFIVIL
jgi:hypothetical protein